VIPSFLLLLPCVLAVALALLVFLLPFALPVAVSLCDDHGARRWARVLGRTARYVYVSGYGDVLEFRWQVSALRESGKIGEAAELARARLAEKDFPAWSRNVAIDVLISAGE
jgi:hypothetical protein